MESATSALKWIISKTSPLHNYGRFIWTAQVKIKENHSTAKLWTNWQKTLLIRKKAVHFWNGLCQLTMCNYTLITYSVYE